MRNKTALSRSAIFQWLFALTVMLGQSPVGFAEILRKDGPPAVFTGSGGSTGGSSSSGSSTGQGNRPFVRFETAEQQKSVFPTPQLGKGEGAVLVEMDKSRKKADLEQLLHMSTDLPGMIKEEQGKGLASYAIEKTAIESTERADRHLPAFSGSHIQVPEGFEVEPIAGPTDSGSPEPRRGYRDLSFKALSGFQAVNRSNASLGFKDLMLAISKDPEVAAAVGADFIVGGVVRPFFNFTAKVGDEMVRTIQCATQGLGVGTGCSTPTEFQDYWGSLMTGEGQSYTAGAIALDTIGIVAGPTIASMGTDAAAAVLKKVPEGIELVAKSVVRGAERIKVGYAAVGFADETGAILIREGERVGTVVSGEAATASHIIESARSFDLPTERLGEYMGRLREATKTRGNFGMGTATPKETAFLGESWVGPNAIKKDYPGKPGKFIYESQDGTKIYREPVLKERLSITQANFEWKLKGEKTVSGNGHLQIFD